MSTVVCPDMRHPHCNVAHERMALERKCIRHALRILRAYGWNVTHTYDGQDRITTKTEREVFDVVFSVDESAVHLQHQTTKEKSWFSVVLGNGIDCIPDYGTCIDPVMSRVYDLFETWS